MNKKLKLTKEFLHNHGYGISFDNNGLFTNHDMIFSIDYLDFSKIDATINNGYGLHTIQDNRLKDFLNQGDITKLKPVDMNNFVKTAHVDRLHRETKYYNMIDTTKFYTVISKGFDGVEKISLQYGIGEYYFNNFIPKLLKLNPEMQLMETQPEQEHAWADMKKYYFVDNNKIVGVLAPASEEHGKIKINNPE